MQIEGSVAIVTGGASGLGRATVEMLIGSGAKVAALDRNPDALADLSRQIADEAAFMAIPCDVTSDTGVESAIGKITDKWESVHCLVNAAGIGAPQRTVSRSGPAGLEGFRNVVDVNLVGTFNVLRVAAHTMSLNAPLNADGERGVIVNTASIAAYDGQIGQASYSASKGGIVAMTLPIARDLARSGVRCLTIAPGIFETPILGGLSEEALDSIRSSILFPSRLGQASEYASLVRFLIESSYINGETIRLDAATRLGVS